MNSDGIEPELIAFARAKFPDLNEEGFSDNQVFSFLKCTEAGQLAELEYRINGLNQALKEKFEDVVFSLLGKVGIGPKKKQKEIVIELLGGPFDGEILTIPAGVDVIRTSQEPGSGHYRKINPEQFQHEPTT
jgi:hypothetical protein